MFEIFQYDFMVRAFIAGIAVAIVAPLIGNYLVVRHYSHMADTLAHVSLLGVAIGIFANINPLLAALLISILSAFTLEKLRHSKRINADAALSLMLSGSLALALVLISLSDGFSTDLFSFLFGSITTVQSHDLILILMLSFALIVTTFINRNEFFLISLDEELATAEGIPSKRLNLLLIVLAALTVSISIPIVGTLLISALMVIPVLTAFQFRRSFRQTLIIALIVSLLSVVLGLYGSFYLDIATGGTIVTISLIFFVLSLILNLKK